MSERDATGLQAFSPGRHASDPLVGWWLGQVSLRLRRELAWCWFQRTGESDPENGVLPPATGLADDALMWSRSEALRRHFFANDATAAFINREIARSMPRPDNTGRGSWHWLAKTLALNPAEQFVLALALAWHLDAGMGPVCAAAGNDTSKTWPTLSLAQRLWDSPEELLGFISPDHRLYRHGLLHCGRDGRPEWHQPLSLPGWLVTELAGQNFTPAGVTVLDNDKSDNPGSHAELIAELSATPGHLVSIPMLGAAEADYPACASHAASQLTAQVVAVSSLALLQHRLGDLLSWCWLRGYDALLPWNYMPEQQQWPLTLPLRIWLPMSREQWQKLSLPGATTPINVDVPDYDSRLGCLQQHLGKRREKLGPCLEECARRFRFSTQQLSRIATQLDQHSTLDRDTLISAFRNQAPAGLQQLAQAVPPRFSLADMVLSPDRQAQLQEICNAANSLTEVHYRWGTARVWNESGLSVLFCGPSGTGKTMAAEAIANHLQLDMYRIDLAQVVNKYIGETEKNLSRIFDAAEASDCLLFFDEADALFGKRTEVKDSHDRYANLEVSYLLERMERFKGIAVLASNRRNDMDEAFLRRLRYVVEFALPDTDERESLWRNGFPAVVDTEDLDFRFLARQFSLSGGNIRSVIFNACLQAAAAPEQKPAKGKNGKPSMRQVLLQVKRELQKLDRSADDQLFGLYAHLLSEEAA